MLSKPVTEQYLILRGVVPIDKVVWMFDFYSKSKLKIILSKEKLRNFWFCQY